MMSPETLYRFAGLSPARDLGVEICSCDEALALRRELVRALAALARYRDARREAVIVGAADAED